MDFESAEDLERALELTGLKVFGNEIKLEKPKGKDSKKGRYGSEAMMAVSTARMIVDHLVVPDLKN